MSWFDNDIGPPPPWMLLWISAVILTVLVFAMALWP